LNNDAIKIMGCVMACLLVVAWFSVFTIMIRAVIMKDILWPQKQEDREEGGWKTHSDEKLVCDTRLCDPDDAVSTAPSRRPTMESQFAEDGQDEQRRRSSVLPIIPERLIDQSLRSREPKPNDDIV
jgi:hypothetical protein